MFYMQQRVTDFYLLTKIETIEEEVLEDKISSRGVLSDHF